MLTKLFLFISTVFMTVQSTALTTHKAAKKILVVVSSENQLALKDGKTYSTGYYLNELTVPAKALVDNGYELVFANPRGNSPNMDIHSDSPKYFGGDQLKYNVYKSFHDQLLGLQQPRKLADVIEQGLEQFAGVFVPGGHAPLIDLVESYDMHRILNYFHFAGKPTALICHGPIALLAALNSAPQVVNALRTGNLTLAQQLAHSWIYAGYNMTVFSTPEEQYAEANQLGGLVQFYPDMALASAQGQVYIAAPWQNNAIRDRELITGQNPFSDETLTQLFLQALSE